MISKSLGAVGNATSWLTCFPPECLCSEYTSTFWIEKWSCLGEWKNHGLRARWLCAEMFSPAVWTKASYLTSWTSVFWSGKWEFCHLHHGVVVGINEIVYAMPFIHCPLCRSTQWGVALGSYYLILWACPVLCPGRFCCTRGRSTSLSYSSCACRSRQLGGATVICSPQPLSCRQICVNNNCCFLLWCLCQTFS